MSPKGLFRAISRGLELTLELEFSITGWAYDIGLDLGVWFEIMDKI